MTAHARKTWKTRPGRLLGWIVVLPAVLAVLAAGCGRPRMLRLNDKQYARLASDDPVDIFVGKVDFPHEKLAVIDSEPYAFEDESIRLKQLTELRGRARNLGGNAVEDVRILTARVQGYTVDEATPFLSWRQGRYELYFMRGTAIRVPETEPASFDELKPRGGWAVDKLSAPPRLEASVKDIPGPGLKNPQ